MVRTTQTFAIHFFGGAKKDQKQDPYIWRVSQIESTWEICEGLLARCEKSKQPNASAGLCICKRCLEESTLRSSWRNRWSTDIAQKLPQPCWCQPDWCSMDIIIYHPIPESKAQSDSDCGVRGRTGWSTCSKDSKTGSGIFTIGTPKRARPPTDFDRGPHGKMLLHRS